MLDLIINNKMTHPEIYSGIVSVSNGRSEPQPLKLQLYPDSLLLQKEEIVDSCKFKDPPSDIERRIKLTKNKTSGLGLSVKGGSEHHLPILISRVTKDQPADLCGQLFIGDAIVKVNEKTLIGLTHDNAVNILRNCGEEAELLVKHYRAATPFLSKSIQEHQQNLDDNIQLISKVESIKNGIQSDVSSDSNDNCKLDMNESQSKKKQWVTIVTVPLMLAYVTRYIYGTDKLRPSAFEVRGIDNSRSGIIHCDQPAVLSEWIKRIVNNIVGLTSLQMKMYNRHFPASHSLSYMGWVCEGFLNNNQPWQNWQPKFLALKGSDVYVFDTPPVKLDDWLHGNQVYCIYSTMFRVIKESEYVDERQHCFLLQTSSTHSHYFSVETKQELLRIETAWHKSMYNAVTQLGSKTYTVTSEGNTYLLMLNWNVGFVLFEPDGQTSIWRYRFSQLKGSSDDGDTKMKLHFQNPQDQCLLETKELECSQLQSLLFCIHAFLTAKVASVDPTFFKCAQLDNGRVSY